MVHLFFLIMTDVNYTMTGVEHKGSEKD